MAANHAFEQAKRHAHKFLTSPLVPATIPAGMIIAFWLGGEPALLAIAVVFPGLLSLATLSTRTPPTQQVLDGTTGLPHRTQLLSWLDKSFLSPDSPEKICIVVEIDDYETLENQFGKATSQHALGTFADRLRGCLRAQDLVCTLGGARFGIAIEKPRRANLEAALQLIARLQSSISEPLSIDGARVFASASVGFVMPARLTDATGESMLNAAETALKAAMNSGQGAIRAFTSDMTVGAKRCEQTGSELLKAMQSGQIVPWFQPQISTDTGQVTGFEALVRWHHPEKGLIAPAAFLPAIARANLHEDLADLMLSSSLKALLAWDKAGLDVPGVAVNFAREDLCNPKLPQKIKWELDRFSVAPERLTVEILENVIAHADDDIATRNIAALVELGCKIDLDDFGTGHASIANIRRFNVHRIKIDRSFVTHVNTDRNQQNMCAAILTMADQLGVQTIAEGVETEGEHAMIAQLGCQHVQGYSIAKPMPLEETENWMENHAKGVENLSAIPRRA